MRLCLAPGCMNVTQSTRCTEHEREYQRAKAQRAQRKVYQRRAYRDASLAGLSCACCAVTHDLTRHHVQPLATFLGERTTVGELPAWAQGFAVVAMCRPCNSSIADRVMATRECPMHGGVIA